jgi:hypothetical protein
MNRKTLEKLKREIALARRSPQKAAHRGGVLRAGIIYQIRRLPRLALCRGSLSSAPNVSPTAGRDLAPGTQSNILNFLEDDILAWEERLGDDE